MFMKIYLDKLCRITFDRMYFKRIIFECVLCLRMFIKNKFMSCNKKLVRMTFV